MSQTTMPKYHQIAGHIRRRIKSRQLAPGAALPSYRAIMREYGVTVTTVRQAMGVLQSEGLVESRQRVGCVVAGVEATTRMIGIAMVRAGGMSSFMAEQLRQLHDELDRLRCHISLRFIDTNDQSLAPAIAWARHLDGVMINGCVKVATARQFADAHVPVILLGEPADGPCPIEVSSVSIDVPSIMRLAMSHLLSLGHQRILFFSMAGTPYFTQLGDTFAACMNEQGLVDGAMHWHPHAIPPHLDERLRGEDDPSTWNAAYAQLIDRLDTLAQPPTAIIVEEGGRASDVAKMLNERGWPVPQRISVFGLSSSDDYANVMTDLTCVVSSARETIKRGAVMIDNLLRTNAATTCREMIVPRFRPGNTCRMLTPADFGTHETSIPSSS